MDWGEVSIETMRDIVFIGMFCISHDTKWGDARSSRTRQDINLVR